MSKTTAEFRKEARAAASRLEWAEAARLMRLAIAAYPKPERAVKDSLAARDIERMEEWAHEWEGAAP